MANHKSALKRNRQNEIRNERNKNKRSRIKNAIKGVLQEVEEKSFEGAQNSLKEASKIISKNAKQRKQKHHVNNIATNHTCFKQMFIRCANTVSHGAHERNTIFK